jgi:hypothetical protein
MLRGYTVTYSFNVTSTQGPQLKGGKQETNGCDEMILKFHPLNYQPRTRQSGWHTSTVPGYIVTYCWDFETDKKWQDPKDEDRNSIGVTDSEAGSQDSTEEEDSGSGNTNWIRELEEFNEIGMRTIGNPELSTRSEVNRQEDRTRAGCPEPQLSSHNIEENKNSCHSDGTDWEKELREVEYTGGRMPESSDSEPELRERHRPINEEEMDHIHRELPHLDHSRRTQLFEFLEMEQPGIIVSSVFSIECFPTNLEQLASLRGSINLENFSDFTLKKICDLVLESTFEIEEGERETRYFGTVQDVVEVRTTAPQVVDRPPLHWQVFIP